MRLVNLSSNPFTPQNSQETIGLKNNSKYGGVRFVDHFFFLTAFGEKFDMFFWPENIKPGGEENLVWLSMFLFHFFLPKLNTLEKNPV